MERPEQDAGPSTRAAIAAGSAVPGRRAGSLPGPASSLTASLPLDSGSKATAPAPARAPSFQPNLEPLRSTLTLEFSWGDIHFSRDGTLGATVQRLVRESAAGRTQKELRTLLHVPAHAFLLAAVRRETLRRERQARIAQRQAAALEPTVIIEVLLALLRHPGSSPAQVACRLQEHAPPITLPQVTAVLTRFDLAQVAGPEGVADG